MNDTEFMAGISRWFESPDYPTCHHNKTATNAALWFWLWYCHAETGNAEVTQNPFSSMRVTGIKTKKDYRRALRDLEALGFIKIIKYGRASLAEDIIRIEAPSLNTAAHGLT